MIGQILRVGSVATLGGCLSTGSLWRRLRDFERPIDGALAIPGTGNGFHLSLLTAMALKKLKSMDIMRMDVDDTMLKLPS